MFFLRVSKYSPTRHFYFVENPTFSTGSNMMKMQLLFPFPCQECVSH
jgi:hypothetical protein